MIFEPIHLEWDGVPYEIKGDQKIMQILASVEEHITFMELQRGRARNAVPFAKLSSAYAVVLQNAGCPVSAAQVYNKMWADGQTVTMILEATEGLLSMMLPRSVHDAALKEQQDAEQAEEAGDPGNAKPRRKKKAGASSSKRTTKSR